MTKTNRNLAWFVAACSMLLGILCLWQWKRGYEEKVAELENQNAELKKIIENDLTNKIATLQRENTELKKVNEKLVENRHTWERVMEDEFKRIKEEAKERRKRQEQDDLKP